MKQRGGVPPGLNTRRAQPGEGRRHRRSANFLPATHTLLHDLSYKENISISAVMEKAVLAYAAAGQAPPPAALQGAFLFPWMCGKTGMLFLSVGREYVANCPWCTEDVEGHCVRIGKEFFLS